MTTVDEFVQITLYCKKCNAVISAADKFCGSCGSSTKLDESQTNPTENVFTTVGPTLAYYFVTLLILVGYKFAGIKNAFESHIVIVIFLDVFTLAFVGYFFRKLIPLLNVTRLSVKITLFTILAAIGAALLVSMIAEVINFALFWEVIFDRYLFEDTSNPLLWAVVFVCIQPAIFEEIAFRGFLFGDLEKVVTPQAAIYVTGFMFGILHLSFISLLWLVPLGVAFAWMRVRYQTIWYGIIGHFVYNFTITMLEFSGFLN